MNPKDRPTFDEPSRWFLCFHRSTEMRWVRWLAWGKYKHVSAFGCTNLGDGQIVWVFYDVNIFRTSIFLAHDAKALKVMEHMAQDADLIAIRPTQSAVRRFRFGLWCVPAVKHLIGIRSSALRPDALWRDCLRNGGEIIDGGRGSATIPATAA